MSNLIKQFQTEGISGGGGDAFLGSELWAWNGSDTNQFASPQTGSHMTVNAFQKISNNSNSYLELDVTLATSSPSQVARVVHIPIDFAPPNGNYAIVADITSEFVSSITAIHLGVRFDSASPTEGYWYRWNGAFTWHEIGRNNTVTFDRHAAFDDDGDVPDWGGGTNPTFFRRVGCGVFTDGGVAPMLFSIGMGKGFLCEMTSSPVVTATRKAFIGCLINSAGAVANEKIYFKNIRIYAVNF